LGSEQRVENKRFGTLHSYILWQMNIRVKILEGIRIKSMDSTRMKRSFVRNIKSIKDLKGLNFLIDVIIIKIYKNNIYFCTDFQLS